MTKVKICGITNLEDARCAAEAGAHFLGFIFHAKSPRFVRPEQAAAITGTLRSELEPRAPRFVGVFVNEPVSHVQQVLERAGLDLAQLHGSESPAQVRELDSRAFKAIRPQTRADAEAAVAAYRHVFAEDDRLPQLLLDAYHPHQLGGTGLPVDLDMAQPIAQQCRLLLAGGLTSETVGAAIRRVQTWGVDVSSGVERAKGLKDHAQVRAFITTVKGALSI